MRITCRPATDARQSEVKDTVFVDPRELHGVFVILHRAVTAEARPEARNVPVVLERRLRAVLAAASI